MFFGVVGVVGVTALGWALRVLQCRHETSWCLIHIYTFSFPFPINFY